MREIVTHLAVDCQNLIASFELAAFNRLPVGHDAFDEYSESSSRAVGSTDDCETQGFLAWTFLEGYSVECAM